MTTRQTLLVYSAFALLLGCAKQTTPTGGPKDEDPPQIIRSIPANRQTNVTRPVIEITFDEYVQLANPREQIIIVPPVGKKFETVAKKNKIILKLNSQLQDTTTYTISFRDAVQDITEKNPARNLKLAFSTGNHIDSLSVKGVVFDLLKGIPVENVTVAVHPVVDTFSIFRQPARFFTLTDKHGNYAIENLKAGNYFIYAFHDKNKNLITDSRSEPFGFSSDTIKLNKTYPPINLGIITLDMRPPKILSAKPLVYHFLLRTNKGFNDYTIESLMPDYTLAYDQPDYSTIRFYNTIGKLDSLPVRLTGSDSIGQKIDTTLHIKFNQTTLQKERFSIKVASLQYLENKMTLKGLLTLDKPYTFINYDSIYIRLDSVTTLRFTADDFAWNKTGTQAMLLKRLNKAVDFTITREQKTISGQMASRQSGALKPMQKADGNKSYNQLIIAKAAILSVESDTNARSVTPVVVSKPETTGTLLTEVTFRGPAITEILDKNYQLVASSTTVKSRFENLPPGEYMIRVIQDSNNNGRWDPGNYNLRAEPESIFFYRDDTGNKSINLKANWEVGPLLIKKVQVVEKPTIKPKKP